MPADVAKEIEVKAPEALAVKGNEESGASKETVATEKDTTEEMEKVEKKDMEVDVIEEEMTEMERYETAVISKLSDIDDNTLQISEEMEVKIEAIRKEYQPKLDKNAALRRDALKVELSVEEGDKLGLSKEDVVKRNGSASPQLPGFWMEVLSNSDFSDLMQNWDLGLFTYLEDITSETTKDVLTVSFHFKQPNPFVHNKRIDKMVMISQSSPYLDDVDVNGTKCTEIDWLPNRNLGKKNVVVKRKVKGTKETKEFTEEKPRLSFFNLFFRNLGEGATGGDNFYGLTDEEIGEEGPEQAEDLLSELLTEHYQMTMLFRDSVIPHAIRYYCGEIGEEDSDDDEEEDDDAEEGSDDDVASDEDEEEEEEEE